MNALVDFIIRLLSDMLQMPVMLGEVALRDPLSTVIVAVGTVFITAAVGVFGYALAGALGIPLPNLGDGPSERIE